MTGIVWQEQVDDGGCGLACLAMLTDQPYARIRASFPNFCNNCGIDGDVMLHWLAAQGYAVQKLTRYQEYDGAMRRWPPRPFAERHLVLLWQSKRDFQLDAAGSSLANSHYVVWDKNGDVFDPADSQYTPSRLSRYYRVIWVAGIHRVGS